MTFTAGQRVKAADLNTNTLQTIQTTTLTATESSVVIPIPTGYSTLECTWQARSTSGNVSDNMQLRVNADSGANYNWQLLSGLNTTVSTTPGIGGQTLWLIGSCVGGAGTGSFFGAGTFKIIGVQQAPSHILNMVGSWYTVSSNTAATSQIGTCGGTYAASSAISSITFTPAFGSFAAGCVFTVLGGA